MTGRGAAAVTRRLKVVTQMRSGTHYLQYLLATSYRVSVCQANREGGFDPLDPAALQRGLYPENRVEIPGPRRGGTRVYFCHYYHPQRDDRDLREAETVSLIGFPFDSFLSDGIAAADGDFHPGPSARRAHAGGYTFRRGSREWAFLEPFMKMNSRWLLALMEEGRPAVLRYEDFYVDFAGSVARLDGIFGPHEKAPPPPVLNPRRLYWTDGYGQAFSPDAFLALWELFGGAVRRFYPEKVEALEAHLRGGVR